MKAFATVILSVLIAVSAFSLTVRDIQYTEDSSGSSPYEDETVTVSGVVTRVFGTDAFIQDTLGEREWSGVQLYRVGSGLKEGDYITVTGIVDEYYGKTEITNISNYTLHASGVTVPEPILIQSADYSEEKYEGVLVIVQDAGVTTTQDNYGDWRINDGSGEGYVTESTYNEYTYTPAVGDTLLFVSGVVDYDYGEYKIMPAGNRDILKSINGSGAARINPKYADAGTILDARLDIFPTVDSIYGIVDFVRVRFPVDSMIDTVAVILDTIKYPNTTITRDTVNSHITVDIFDAHLIDTLTMYIDNRYFSDPDTFRVYTGEDASFFGYIAQLPVIDVMPEMDIITIGEVQSTIDGYNSIYAELAQTVTIQGIVTGSPAVFTPTSTSTGFYLEDETGGVNIYSSNDPMNTTFTVGMELVITGTVTEYNGLTEVKYSSPDTNIMIINDTVAVPMPYVLANSQGVNELNEGRLLQAQYAKVMTAPVSAGTGKNFQILNGQTLIDCRVTEKSPFYNTDEMNAIKPGILLNVTGIGGQYDSEAPYTSGYQLQIRTGDDVEFIEADEDSVFGMRILPNPVSFERGETSRIEIDCLNEDRVTARIFDLKGRLIATLAQNVPGSTVIVWDGRDYSGKYVNIAAYIVVVDKVSPDGKTVRLTKPIIVTTDLN